MNIELYLILIPCHFDYQPSHLFYIPRSHQHINPIHNHRFPCIAQASYFKWSKSINQTIHNNHMKKTTWPSTGLAQARGVPSLKL